MTARRIQTGGFPSLDGAGYDDLIEAWAGADVRWSGPDPHLVKFLASRPEYEAIVARLEQLGESDTAVVRAVADALARPHPAHRVRGDLDQAEAAMALAAYRRSTYLTTDRACRRGPFAAIDLNTRTNP